MMFPNHFVQDRVYRVPITGKIIVQIEHWANLWACNIGALLGDIADLKSDRSKQLWLAVKPWQSGFRSWWPRTSVVGRVFHELGLEVHLSSSINIPEEFPIIILDWYATAGCGAS